MLATVFSAVLFAVSFVPGNVDATASAEPTCCAKHAYCCTINARCCGKHADANAVDVASTQVASTVGQPTCCAKRAYCCSVGGACCGKTSSDSSDVEPAVIG